MAHGILTLLAALTMGVISLLDPEVLRGDDGLARPAVRPAEMPRLAPPPLSGPAPSPLPDADLSDLIEA